MEETVFALSSGQGRAGIAVIRISGDRARSALETLTGRAVPAARRASVRRLADPASGEQLDEALVLWLPGPATVTGEDMAELHVHGSRAVVGGVLDALGTLDGLRLAEPGEFTRRAFANGRMDLTQVEGLADLIDAETAGQRRLALAQAQGALAGRCSEWRNRLVRALALVEAEIDFSDEELPDGLDDQALSMVMGVAKEIREVVASGCRGELMRDGVQVAILGPPNVGKSSLLNRLAGRDAAIVSDISGTTRDIVEVTLDLGGVPVVLADTAGLRQTDDPVELEGISRARARASASDIAVWVVDLADPAPPVWPEGLQAARRVVVGNKSDVGDTSFPCDLVVSAGSGSGMDDLERFLADAAQDLAGRADGSTLVSRVRQQEALGDCLACLDRACEEAWGEAALAGEEVRLGMRALGRLVGRVDVDDILDVIFRDFCIGK
jgi:tRNA modification GTPase